MTTAAAMPHDALLRRELRLAYFTIAWDVVEGVVAVTAGVIAKSIVLIGFGLDSAIEVFASIIVADINQDGLISADDKAALLRRLDTRRRSVRH